MRETAIFEKYSKDKEYRYIIYERDGKIYDVWVQKKTTDEYMGEEWFTYFDIPDSRHLSDTLKRAMEIGDELIKSLMPFEEE